MFPPERSGRSITFPIKKESIKSATSSLFSKRADGNEPYRVGFSLPPTQSPRLVTSPGFVGPPSSLRTLTDVHRVASVPVEKKKNGQCPTGQW